MNTSKAVLIFCSLFSVSAFSAEFDLLKELVSISSGTADVSGVNAVQKRVAEEMKRIGLTPSFIENPDAHFQSGKLLVGVASGASSKFITLVGHADTVFEKLNPFTVSSDGKIAKGSGVSDNKGGVVVGLSAVEQYLKMSPRPYSIRFVVSPSEEIGSNGFESIFKEFGKNSEFVIGLEPARENANIIIGRKGVRWYQFKVTGREAHAGVDHDFGINACDELAIKAHALQKLTNYKKGTTVNIGHVEGGKNKFNIVCGSAEAKIDVRYATVDESKKVFADIDRILKTPTVQSARTKEFSKIEIDSSVDTPPYASEKKTAPLLKLYLETVKKIENRTIQGETTGGVGDLNIMSRPGLMMLDGLGPIGGGYHTADEFVEVGSLVSRSQALAELLKQMK